MLKSSYYSEPSELDVLIFEKLIPQEHLLRKVKATIDFEAFRGLVKECYSQEMGRTAEDPVRMIKIEFLQFLYGLSDREVLNQIQVNVAYRYFLELSMDSALPSHGLLSQFRSRLGEKRHEALFNEVVAQARQKGLVKDRLRLKDATHIIANVAIPSGIALIAQARDRLLRAAKVYDPAQVEAQEQRVVLVREMSEDLRDNDRLMVRLNHLREIVSWADELQARLTEPTPKTSGKRQRFDEALRVAHRILEQADRVDPPDQTRSSVDPDARRSKHGEFFDGYKLDISVDADSELLTMLAVPLANCDEAAQAKGLIQREEQVHGNDVQALSMDGIGFRGDILRTLQDPHGLGLNVFVPTYTFTYETSPYYPPTDFQLRENGSVLVCPNGCETRRRARDDSKNGWLFRFHRAQCADCPLLANCLEKLPATQGRTVRKNDYEAEFLQAKAVSQSAAYALVRKDHPKVERKLAEFIRYHQGRRTRYRGRPRVAIQYLMTGLVINVKRMLKLLFAPQAGSGMLAA